MHHRALPRLIAALLLTFIGLAAPAATSSAASQAHVPPPAVTVIPATGACFTARLTGLQETPPVTTTAGGLGTFVLSADQTRLTFAIQTTGTFTETGAHIHRAEPGVPGGIVFPLPAGSLKTGSWTTLNVTNTADLLAGNLYVNVHSSAYPGGEIRGQIVPGSGCFAAHLSGLQEVPPITTTAGTGHGVFALSPDQTTLVYDIVYSGLSITETAAHIHVAPVGVPGPVVFPLPAGSPKSGSWVGLSGQNLDDLLAGNLYANVHTSNHPAGEIRGQLLPASMCFTAALSGLHETPPITSTAASGLGSFVYSPAESTLRYQVRYRDLSAAETFAHIHEAPFGVPGPVVFPLPGGPVKEGTITLTVTNTASLLGGQYYVNVHTGPHPTGEIRGQIVPGACQSYLPEIGRQASE